MSLGEKKGKLEREQREEEQAELRDKLKQEKDKRSVILSELTIVDEPKTQSNLDLTEAETIQAKIYPQTITANQTTKDEPREDLKISPEEELKITAPNSDEPVIRNEEPKSKAEYYIDYDELD